MLIATYLLASLSSAIIVCRIFGLADPRTVGSKNPGTTNVLRMAGKWPAFLTLLGDALKGLIPVLLARLYFTSEWMASLVALVAVVGHCFPLYYRFKGGKGVATTFGALFGLSWILGLICVGAWLVVALLFRYSSLAALVAVGVVPLVAGFMFPIEAVVPLGLMAIMVLFLHRENVIRLCQGKESKIGQKKSLH